MPLLQESCLTEDRQPAPCSRIEVILCDHRLFSPSPFLLTWAISRSSRSGKGAGATARPTLAIIRALGREFRCSGTTCHFSAGSVSPLPSPARLSRDTQPKPLKAQHPASAKCPESAVAGPVIAGSAKFAAENGAMPIANRLPWDSTADTRRLKRSSLISVHAGYMSKIREPESI